MNGPSLKSAPGNIQELVNSQGGIRLSLYLPIHKQPPESEQNVTRLRNLLRDARARLEKGGMEEEGEIEDFLRPIQEIADPPQNMLRPATSLGLFRDDSGLAIVEIPYAVETRLSVSDRFLVKPLLPMLHTDRPYVALRLSRGEVRAYRGGRSTIHEIEIPGMPGALEDVTKFDDPEKSLQQHTSKTISAKGRPGTTTATVQHGQGLPADMEDQQFDRFFRSVAHALDSFLSKEDIPPVVFGVEENLGYLRNVHDWSTRTLHTRAVDASEWSADQVRAAAWQLLEPERGDEKAGYLARIEAAANKGELLIGIKDCALAAATGRIELAVIAEGVDLEGVCDAANMEVKTVEEADLSRSHDLPDFIATETLRHGGQVLLLPAEEIPGNSDAVALARF